MKADGTLKISVEETAKTLTVTATSKLDESKSATATVTVTDEIVEPNITVTITPEELKVDANPGQKGQFTALVEGAEDDDTVTWTISGNSSEETLITNGQLFLGTDETATEMTVTATSNENPDSMGTAKVIVVRSNKTLLQKTYDYAKNLSTEGVTDSAKAYFEKVLAEAEAVLNDGLADQETVNQAWDNLLEGIWGLNIVQGDKTMLEQLIAKADNMVANESKYVQDNWQQLVDALADAKAVMEDGDALEEDIQPVADALLDAILAQRYKANKANLEELIKKAEAIDLSKYTEESVAVFRAALNVANLVMDDMTLSEDDQSVVDNAEMKLRDAIENLSLKDEDDNNSSEGNDPSQGGSSSDNDSSKPETSKPESSKPEADSPATSDISFPLFLIAAMMSIAAAGAYLFHRRCRN